MKNTQERLTLLLTFVLAALIIAAHLYSRPLLPVDETRYLSVAWEMWQSGNWLVPHQNGEFYGHKPPLLFWLINLSWGLFGVSETAARLCIPVIACLSYPLVGKLANRLYPDNPTAASLSPLILLSFLGWQLYVPAVMFDLLLTVFVLSAYLALWHFGESGRYRYAILAGIASGLGMLTKGPVIFVYLLPFMFSFRLWRRYNMVSGKVWLKGCTLGILVSLPVLLAWALPAIMSAGDGFAFDVFWHQSVGRLHKSFAHARPLYWYLMMLPVLLFPWPFLIAAWKKTHWQRGGSHDSAILLSLALVLLIFSLISGKQIHYLYPVFPLLAIFLAAKLNAETFRHEPLLVLALLAVTGLIMSADTLLQRTLPLMEPSLIRVDKFWALLPLLMAVFVLLMPYLKKLSDAPVLKLQLLLVASCIGILALLPAISPVLKLAYDVSPTAKEIAAIQASGHPVAYAGKYHAQFQFLGRLKAPLTIIEDTPRAIQAWSQAHPDGFVIKVLAEQPSKEESATWHIHPYRSKLNAVIPVGTLNGSSADSRLRALL